MYVGTTISIQMIKYLLRLSDPEKPKMGFHSDGICAHSRTEIMGDPCQILPKSLWDQWVTFELRNHAEWRKWRTVWFMGVPMQVIDVGSDGNWWGCVIDTATCLRMWKSDLEILRAGYGD
jgi:hypothetical protein